MAKKKKTQMKDLGKTHIKEALRRVHPFLNKSYRELNKDELNSLEVFNELFPNEEFKQFKLDAIYAFQN